MIMIIHLEEKIDAVPEYRYLSTSTNTTSIHNYEFKYYSTESQAIEKIFRIQIWNFLIR